MRLPTLFFSVPLILPWVAWGADEKEPLDELKPLVVTARGGFAEPLAKTPWSVSSLSAGKLSMNGRSMPESLTALPSVMVQKTAMGQSSPYLRGLTGYHNVLLVDGIRLNHSAMRSGPNQYWSTVDLLRSGGLEIVRGPHGIRYGTDAVGGVVNVLSGKPRFTEANSLRSANFFGRLSSAESSWTGGLETQWSSPSWALDLSHLERSFGDLEGGHRVGEQSGTGYDSQGTNLRMVRKLSDTHRLAFGFQRVFMDGVPRTHKTVDGLTWQGLTAGTELWRRLDQERKLTYGRLSWEDAGGIADSGSLTLSLHQHGQERNRMKATGGIASGGDFQAFDLDDVGFTARFETDDRWGGRLAYGGEMHRESVNSDGYEFDANQAFASILDQGPLAADATYTRYACYLSDTFETANGFVLEPGIRFARFEVEVDKAWDASKNLVSFDRDYEEAVGSLRAFKNLDENRLVYAGVSQGFRTPSLYDLTSHDETSVRETPSFNLQPERFMQAEIGTRGSAGPWDWSLAAYHTWIDDMIVRSPKNATGSTVVKANGDGFIQGLEAEIGYAWTNSWKTEIAFSWMDGEVEQLLLDGAGSVTVDGSTYSQVERPTDRLMPVQLHLTSRWQPNPDSWWVESYLWAMGRADELSMRDERDDSRIPSSGTPGFAIYGLRTGHQLNESSAVSIAVENLGDVDYRVHGSGLNGPGRNFVLSFSKSF